MAVWNEEMGVQGKEPAKDGMDKDLAKEMKQEAKDELRKMLREFQLALAGLIIALVAFAEMDWSMVFAGQLVCILGMIIAVDDYWKDGKVKI